MSSTPGVAIWVAMVKSEYQLPHPSLPCSSYLHILGGNIVPILSLNFFIIIIIIIIIIILKINECNHKFVIEKPNIQVFKKTTTSSIMHKTRKRMGGSIKDSSLGF